MTEIVRLYGEGLAKPDELTLARIEREREEASQRLAKTRDVAAWQATMARLDAEQQVARQPRQQQRMAPDEVVAYLRSLPTLWNDAGPEGRQALASALFTKLEVEGYTKMRYQLTPDAVTLGLGAALPAQTGDRWSHRWVWSGREDLNLRPQRPERCALPNCATPRLKGPPRHIQVARPRDYRPACASLLIVARVVMSPFSRSVQRTTAKGFSTTTAP